MSINRKFTLLGAAVFTISVVFLYHSAEAATLSSFFGSAFNGNSGTDSYDSGAGLSGTVEYAVFSKADFDSLFTGSTIAVNPGELAYVYQFINTGADALSQNTQLGVNSSVVALGSATIDIGASEFSPSSTTLNAGFSAIWGFEPSSNNIPGGGAVSSALVLTSTNLPGNVTALAIVKDGGTIATTMAIVPGATAIPEPTSLLLLSCGALFLLGRRRV